MITIKKDMHMLLKVLMLLLLSSPVASLFAAQKVDYQIVAELDVRRKLVRGNMNMTYHNNSSDTLTEVWIHLWPNAYSSHQTAWAQQVRSMGMLDFHYSKSFGKIDSVSFSIDGKSVANITSEESPDMVLLIPNQPILPGQQVQIATPFRTRLSPAISRSGYDSSYFALAQWYPKPAVYNEKGWNPMPYLEQGEFFSEFGDYNVKITLPKAYVLTATGHQVVLPDTLNTSENTLTYNIQQKNVHDFAWFASEKFKVASETIQLSSGKKVLVQAVGITEGLEKRALSFATFTLQYMSENLGEYPYDVCTVVEGPAGMGGGMEYPTIGTVGEYGLMETTVHEIIHNWWYGILANNEREKPWLDESITSYYEHRVVNQISADSIMTAENYTGRGKFFGFNRLPSSPMEKFLLLNQQRLNKHQAISSSSEALSPTNYYAVIYAKGALVLDYLEKYLGQAMFDAAMKSFFEKHAFTHIDETQLQNTFEAVSGQNLDWFFKGMIASTIHVDIAIKKAERNGDSLRILLDNKGDYPSPALIQYADKAGQTQAHFWTPPFLGELEHQIPYSDSARQIIVDADWQGFEDNRNNNYYKLNKAFPRFEPVRFQLFGAPEDPSRNQLFYSPVLGGNVYDGFQLGLALYNRAFPAKKLEYELVPMFAFKSKQFNWIANVSYHILPKKQKPLDIELGLHAKSFSMNDRPELSKFYKLQPFVELTFDKSKSYSGTVHKLSARNVSIWEDFYRGSRDTLTSEISFEKNVSKFNVTEIAYSFQQNSFLYPTSAGTKLQFNKDFVKQSFELKQAFRYTQKGAFVHVRLFAGAFYYRNSDVSFRLNRRVGYNISGIAGKNDYLYDHHYFGRNEQSGFVSQQLAMGEGNFKVQTLNLSPMEGQTVNALMAANFKIDFPIKWIPIKLFADLGYSVDKVIATVDVLPVKQFHYDLGFCFSVLDESIEIYFPLAMSENFRSYYKSNLPKFGQRITFMIDLNKLNIHKFARDIPFEKFQNRF